MLLSNRFGHGIARTTTALELNGNPPAEFAFDQGALWRKLLAKKGDDFSLRRLGLNSDY